MPLYDFKCPSCGTVSELFMPVKDYAIPACLDCNCDMRRIYYPPAGVHIFEERHHAGLGAHVKSKRHMKEVMRQKEEEYFNRRGEVIKFEEP